jgi:hypothetical protein
VLKTLASVAYRRRASGEFANGSAFHSAVEVVRSMKIINVVGARPNFVKMAAMMEAFGAWDGNVAWRIARILVKKISSNRTSREGT